MGNTTASTTTGTGRIIAYDALRAFAILTVVAIHTLMPYRDVLPETSPVRVLDDVLHYAVPLFVFISGALLWSRAWPHGPGTYRTFISRRLAVIGAPYLAWALVYAALFVARAAEPFSAAQKVPGLIANGHIWYHLYFIPMLLTFYAITPVASRLGRRNPELLLAASLILRVILGPAAIRASSEINPLLAQYVTHVLTHLPHMALGAWFAMRYAKLPQAARRSWPILLAGGLAALGAISWSGLPSWPMQLHRLAFPAAMTITVLGLVLGALALEPRYERHARALTRAGALSFGVYFVHPLLLLGVDSVAARFPQAWPWGLWWFPVVVWLGVSTASFGLSGLLARDRHTAWLVGYTLATHVTKARSPHGT